MKFTVATVVCVGRDEAEFRRRAIASGQDPDQARAGAAGGTPDEVVERILEFGREGAETVYLQYHTLDEPDHLELIGTEVLATARGARRDAALRRAHRPAAHLDRRAAAAVAPDRGARLRLDLDLGPLLRGRRDGRPALLSRRSPRTPRSRPRPSACAAVRSCTPRATGTRRCSPTRWRPSTRSRTAGPCSASAAAGCAASTTRTACTTAPPASGCACSRSTCSASAACSREDRTTFDGEFFHLHDAQCEPKPVQARLPIWIGGGGEKVTLRIAAQYADGWNVPFIPPDVWAHKARVLDAHCERLGRDPGGDHQVGQRRDGVHRRGAPAPVRPDGRRGQAGRALRQRRGDGRQGRRVRRRGRRPT